MTNWQELDHLPRAERLALAYAPAAERDRIAALFQLDNQLARFVREAQEPVLAQMRLAWWRDRFSEGPALWPKGNPLLSAFEFLGDDSGELVALVDGWEALLAESPLGPAPLEERCIGLAAAWEALAKAFGVPTGPVAVAAKRWALCDLATSLEHESDRSAARDLADCLPSAGKLPAPLRPLAVLDTLAKRAIEQARPPLEKPGDLFAALRRGLFGR